MTLYCFYQYDRTMSKEEYRRLKSHGYSKKDMNALYAVTIDKKIAKQFIRERDMRKFLLIKKEIDKELYKEFSNKRRGIILAPYAFTFYPHIKKNDDTEETAYIVCTFLERMQVESQADQSLMGFIESIDFQDPFCLQTKWLDELRILEYDTIYKMFIANSLSYQGIPSTAFIPYDEDYMEAPVILLDELQIFILNFGKYFK